ncbi:MAG: hypothetical protein AVW06_00165 [Hadesarchaea archaeon DG-33-1]|nr:MAG: hypothetical protein AVW06_00165 [Hadesarchaea archaeon DG-33-1]
MNVYKLKKWKIRGKKVINTGIRLVIRRGATEDEWEIPLSRPNAIEGNHGIWFHRLAKNAELALKAKKP